MRFYTESECQRWIESRGRQLPSIAQGIHRERVSYPNTPGRFGFAARWIASEFTYRRPALLWVTDWPLWDSANAHLYYRLRQSYGDHRLLEEAPGHLFLGYETEDLASFLQLSMLTQWDGYVLTEAGYVDISFSHDEFLDFFSSEASHLSEIRKTLGSAG